MKLIALAFLIGISITSFGQTMDCSKFKDGTFKIVDLQSGTSIIKRKGNKQVETISKEKGKATFIVNWVNECTYTLTPTEKTMKKLMKEGLPKDAVLTVTIMEVKENSYVQTSTANFADIIHTSEMVKIK